MMTSEIFLKTMFEFCQKAGDIALAEIDHSAPSLKADQSIITRADKAISQLAKESLAEFLNQDNHILIDEEDPSIGQYLTPEKLNKSTYIWAVDPIDGTRLYANRMPLFGVSIGLLKDLKPWMGVVYFPMLKELFFCDGQEAYFVQNAFLPNEKRVKIVPLDEELSPKSLFFCNDTFFHRFAWKDKDFHIMIHACAVVNLCWPAIGRGVGCYLRCSLWDFAGSWPIVQKAGLEFRRVSDGKVLDRIDHSIFTQHPKPWQLKEFHLVSSARNFLEIQSKIIESPSSDVK